jgi:transposase-like protein
MCVLPHPQAQHKDPQAVQRPKTIHRHRRNAPTRAPCPHCGCRARRKGFHERTIRGIAYHAILIIHIHTAEYEAACDCCTTFRTQIDGVEPYAKYTNEVREAVLDRLILDNMNMEQIHAALYRDFHLDLSDGFLYDTLDWKTRQLDGAAYRSWTLANFSGTLCIDELHLGKKTLLLATDPISNFPVAFALVSANDQEHMTRFLHQLQMHGFQPSVVITDGSNLYPAVLAAIWPQAQHQLCVFHVIKDVNQEILDSLRRLRRQLQRRGNQGRRRGRGRPRQGQRRRGLTLKDKANFIFKHRYLIVTRRDHLGRVALGHLATMLEYLPALRTLREFVDEVHALFASSQTLDQAQRRHQALLGTSAYQADPQLAKVLVMLAPEKFAKMIAFLRSPAGQRVRTNNHVERSNRQLRLLEKVRYKWRSRRTIVRFVVLVFHLRWQAHSQPPEVHRPARTQPAGGRRPDHLPEPAWLPVAEELQREDAPCRRVA